MYYTLIINMGKQNKFSVTFPFKFLVALFFSLLLDLFHTLTNLPVISFSNIFLLQVFCSSLVDSRIDLFSYLMYIY
jgi:hypothetical protein